MQKKFVPAYLLVLVNVLGYSLLLPVLPFVVVDYYGAPKYVYGLLLSCYSVFQFLGAPYLGRLSDTLGRKPVLLISQIGSLMSWIIFGLSYFVPNIPLLGFALPLFVIAFSRVLDGITGGNSSVAQAYVSDITTKEEKNYIFAYIGGVVGIGMIIGPAIGGFSASYSIGYLGTVVVAGLLSLGTVISIVLWLQESLPKEKRKPKEQQSIIESIRLIKRIRGLQSPKIIQKVFVLRTLFGIMMAVYISTIALFIIDLFLFNEQELGLFMLVVGGFISFNQAVMSKWFISRFGVYRTLQMGLFLTCLGCISITLTDILWVYILLYYILNLGIALCSPTLNSLLAQHAQEQEIGEVMGIGESIGSLCFALFPFIGASIYGLVGAKLYWGVSVLPLLGLWLSMKKMK